jgi:hypothetical protein
MRLLKQPHVSFFLHFHLGYCAGVLSAAARSSAPGRGCLNEVCKQCIPLLFFFVKTLMTSVALFYFAAIAQLLIAINPHHQRLLPYVSYSYIMSSVRRDKNVF